MRLNVPGEKPLHWVGSALKEVRRFPAEVQRTVGFALGAAQFGGKHPAAKPWKGDRSGILEIVKDNDGDTFRAIYAVRFARAVYVLRAFQRNRPRALKRANPISI
jgi:phage-related protein